MISNNEVKH